VANIKKIFFLRSQRALRWIIPAFMACRIRLVMICPTPYCVA